VSDVEWNDGRFNSELRAVIMAKLRTIAARYQVKIQQMFRAPKSGRIYRVGSTPTKRDRAAGRDFRAHQASAPGEAPAIDHGHLARSVTHEITEAAGAFHLDIGPATQSGREDIAAYLEFGTSKIQPRPAWRPALEAVAAETEREIVITEG
jgi:hypothetical protein